MWLGSFGVVHGMFDCMTGERFAPRGVVIYESMVF